MSANQPAKRLGELLVARRLITPAQLQEALRQQEATKEFLGAVLVRTGLIKAEALLTTLSEQFGIPHESLSPERVDWTVVGQFAASALADGRCFPIRADEQSVTVAIVNPLDAWALSAVEQAARFRTVKPVLVLERELHQVMQAYRQKLARSITAQLKGHDGDQSR